MEEGREVVAAVMQGGEVVVVGVEVFGVEGGCGGCGGEKDMAAAVVVVVVVGGD